MDNRNEEIEIDLVRMAKYLISKWKIVLVLGIIFAALGFTYKFLNYQLSSVPLAEVDKLFKIEREVKQPNGQIQKVESKVSYRLYVEDYESKMYWLDLTVQLSPDFRIVDYTSVGRG